MYIWEKPVLFTGNLTKNHTFLLERTLNCINGNAIFFINIKWKDNIMFAKKQNNFKSPDLNKMQEVIINARTRIYVEKGLDPEEAKERYLERLENRRA